jgi:hypothetical protein
VWFATESGGKAQQLVLGLCSLLIVPISLWQYVTWGLKKAQDEQTISIVVLYFIILHVVTLPCRDRACECCPSQNRCGLPRVTAKLVQGRAAEFARVGEFQPRRAVGGGPRRFAPRLQLR